MKKLTLFVLMLLLGIVTSLTAQTLLNENFDGTWPPAGWNVDGTQRVGGSVTTPYTSPYCVYFDAYTDALRTPQLAYPEPGYSRVATYYHKNLPYPDPRTHYWFQVGTSPTGPWTDVEEIVAPYGWEPKTVDLAAWDSQLIYIRFAMNPADMSSYCPPPPDCFPDMFIDGVRVDEDTTEVPVELSSFTASLVQEQEQSFVELHWVTQSETQVAGYNILRNSAPAANTATQLNLSIIEANNASITSNYSFSDAEPQTGVSYYWLQSNDMDGTVQLFGPISINIETGSQTPGIGVLTSLGNIYPNPVSINSPRTVIPFQLNSKSDVRLEIYNQKGQLVWSYARSNADAGLYQIDWNGTDYMGKQLSTGVYFCRMNTGDYQGVKKMLVIK